MARPLLIFPGERCSPVLLSDVLRESHDAYRASVVAEIEARTAKKTPLDDETVWGDVEKRGVELLDAISKKDTVKVSSTAMDIAGMTSGNALEDPGPFTPADIIEGVTVTMQIVDDSTALGWRARRIALATERRAARTADNAVVAVAVVDEKMTRLYEEIVCRVVVHIDGIDGLKAKDGAVDVVASMPGLRLVGLLGWLYSAAQAFLDLPVEKALRCGQPAPST